ncbi:hypothetical protein JL722_11903 [Aureococcus anophagefferens]|nr:hypothetical protein JL722_11903 [Aureococcus anophagefferens]
MVDDDGAALIRNNIAALLIACFGHADDDHADAEKTVSAVAASSVAALAATCRRANALVSPGLAAWGAGHLDATLEALESGKTMLNGALLHRGPAVEFAASAISPPSSLRAHATANGERLVRAVLATVGDATCEPCQQRALRVLTCVLMREGDDLSAMCTTGLGALLASDARGEELTKPNWNGKDIPRLGPVRRFSRDEEKEPWPTLWNSLSLPFTSVDREDGLSREDGEIVEEVFPWYELQDDEDEFAAAMMIHGQLATNLAIQWSAVEYSYKGLGAGDGVDAALTPLLEFLDAWHDWDLRSIAAQSALTVIRAYDSDAARDAIQDADVVWDLARLLAEDPGRAAPGRGSSEARTEARAFARRALAIHAEGGADFAVHVAAALLEAGACALKWSLDDTFSLEPPVLANHKDPDKERLRKAIRISKKKEKRPSAAALSVLAVHDGAARTCEDAWAKAASDCVNAVNAALVTTNQSVTRAPLSKWAPLLRCGAFEALARVACDARTIAPTAAMTCATLSEFFESEPSAALWRRAQVWRFVVRATRRVAEWEPGSGLMDEFTICALLTAVTACATTRPPGSDAEAEFRDACYVLLDAAQPGGKCARAPVLPAALLLIMECCLPAPGRYHVALDPARAGPKLVKLLGNETELEPISYSRLGPEVFDPDGSFDAQSQLLDAPSIVESRELSEDGEAWLRHAATAVDPLLAALRWQTPGASFAGALLGALCEHDADDAYEGDNEPLSYSLSRVLFEDVAGARKGRKVVGRILERRKGKNQEDSEEEESREMREARAETAEAELLALLDDEEKKEGDRKRGGRRARRREEQEEAGEDEGKKKRGEDEGKKKRGEDEGKKKRGEDGSAAPSPAPALEASDDDEDDDDDLLLLARQPSKKPSSRKPASKPEPVAAHVAAPVEPEPAPVAPVAPPAPAPVAPAAPPAPAPRPPAPAPVAPIARLEPIARPVSIAPLPAAPRPAGLIARPAAPIFDARPDIMTRLPGVTMAPIARPSAIHAPIARPPPAPIAPIARPNDAPVHCDKPSPPASPPKPPSPSRAAKAAAPAPPPTTLAGVLARVGLGHLEPIFDAEEVDFEALGLLQCLLRPDDYASLGISPSDANAIVTALAAPLEARFLGPAAAPAGGSAAAPSLAAAAPSPRRRRRARPLRRVVWFNEKKFHGFIKPDGGGDDLFVHGGDVGEPLKTGDRVRFDVARYRGRDNYELMQDPVIASDGHTYERSAIAAWFERRRTSPITNEDLPNLDLVPAHAMRSLIARWLETNAS